MLILCLLLGVVRFLSRLASIRFFAPLKPSEREQWLTRHAQEKESDLHDIDGTYMEILQLGTGNLSTSVADETVERFLTASAPIPTSEIHQAIPPANPDSKARRHTLFFLPQFWRIEETQSVVHPSDFKGQVVDLDAGTAPASAAPGARASAPATATVAVMIIEGLTLSGHPVGILASKQGVPVMDAKCMLAAIKKALPDEKGTTVDEAWSIVDHHCPRFTPATYKSALQKLIRFRPTHVQFAGHAPVRLEARHVLLCILCRLVMHPGSFVPDIQRFVSGLESVKRLAVCAFEDSYVSPEQMPDVVHLLSAALLAQRFKSWRPTEDHLVRWCRIALRLHAESRAFDYVTSPPASALVKAGPGKADSAIHLCGALLASLGSLQGDHHMVADIAKHEGKKLVVERKLEPHVMPWEHILDQHCATSVAYFFDPKAVGAASGGVGSRPFQPLFAQLFQKVTGLNPRRHDLVRAFQVGWLCGGMPVFRFAHTFVLLL